VDHELGGEEVMLFAPGLGAGQGQGFTQVSAAQLLVPSRWRNLLISPTAMQWHSALNRTTCAVQTLDAASASAPAAAAATAAATDGRLESAAAPLPSAMHAPGFVAQVTAPPPATSTASKHVSSPSLNGHATTGGWGGATPIVGDGPSSPFASGFGGFAGFGGLTGLTSGGGGSFLGDDGRANQRAPPRPAWQQPGQYVPREPHYQPDEQREQQRRQGEQWQRQQQQQRQQQSATTAFTWPDHQHQQPRLLHQQANPFGGDSPAQASPQARGPHPGTSTSFMDTHDVFGR
jgi:hypothetical protein